MTPETTRAGEYRAAGTGSAAAVAIGAAAAAQAGAENFPVALRLLPRRYRRHLAAVYRFARSADDMGDEAAPGQRLELLDELEADIRRLYRKVRRAGSTDGTAGPGSALAGAGAEPDDASPRLPVVRELARTVVSCAIPAQPFLDLIEANRQDQVVTRYPAFADLLGYCQLSANPVGRIVLHVFGAATPEREALSDQVCTALQLAEHWQDVAEDLRAGRVYLPLEDLDRFGVTEADLAAPQAAPSVRALIAFEEHRARELLDAGAPIVGTLRGAARAAVAGYVAGGRAALAAIAASGHDPLSATPRPGRRRVAGELVRAYATGR
ncbi:MAG TPA: squalene synthase HpnC [Streptosporangiaceae bacterium]|nr:squalene synthase HpnC [Streptosporangiaceae bacterium]